MKTGRLQSGAQLVVARASRLRTNTGQKQNEVDQRAERGNETGLNGD